MVSVGIGAGFMTDKGTVGRLLSLLSSSHLSALLVWPINSGGNRKGVTELVDLVCTTLNSVFMASEVAPGDASRKHAEHALVVGSLTTVLFDLRSLVLRRSCAACLAEHSGAA